jgi:hypothetical protein
MDSADSCDLGVGRADGTAGALSCRDHSGIPIGSKDIEGLNSAAEVGIDDRVDGVRQFVLAAAMQQVSAYMRGRRSRLSASLPAWCTRPSPTPGIGPTARP